MGGSVNKLINSMDSNSHVRCCDPGALAHSLSVSTYIFNTFFHVMAHLAPILCKITNTVVPRLLSCHIIPRGPGYYHVMNNSNVISTFKAWPDLIMSFYKYRSFKWCSLLRFIKTARGPSACREEYWILEQTDQLWPFWGVLVPLYSSG